MFIELKNLIDYLLLHHFDFIFNAWSTNDAVVSDALLI